MRLTKMLINVKLVFKWLGIKLSTHKKKWFISGERIISKSIFCAIICVNYINIITIIIIIIFTDIE